MLLTPKALVHTFIPATFELNFLEIQFKTLFGTRKYCYNFVCIVYFEFLGKMNNWFQVLQWLFDYQNNNFFQLMLDDD